MNKEEFILELQKINIKLNNHQLQQLEKFYNLLIMWNKQINLTAITSKEEVYLKHFYDSLTIIKAIDLQSVKTLCDVGTGAGFPGIVLKIAFPHLKVTLLDSLQKRVTYLNEVIKELDLKDIEAYHVRGEDYNNKFDIVTARAVANIEKLLGYTMHLVNDTGHFIAMKGNIDTELTPKIRNKITKKYQIESIIKFTLPKEFSNRSLIVLKNK